MEDHLKAQGLAADMEDAELLVICNTIGDEDEVSPLALAAMDELIRRGVVSGALGFVPKLAGSPPDPAR